MKININGKEVVFNKEDFPMLIHGAPGAGSSFFSVSLMASLFKQGEKVVLFSAYEQAKELFKEQIEGLYDNRALIIESGDDKLFINQLKSIDDLSERIILYKNIDDYDFELFNKLKDLKLVIFSGDIDRCAFREELLKIDFKNKIFFSYSEKVEIPNKIELPKYSGHIMGSKNGIIKLEIQ